MKRIKTNRIFNILFACIAMMIIMGSMEACSKKSNSSKSTAKAAVNSEPAVKETPPPAAPPVKEKDGLEIKRDASGNYVIQIVITDMEAVKLMKPVREGYRVWMVNENNVTTSIGTIEGADTWTAKKDKVNFEGISAVRPVKIFITAEINLKTEKPGTQVVWSTKNF